MMRQYTNRGKGGTNVSSSAEMLDVPPRALAETSPSTPSDSSPSPLAILKEIQNYHVIYPICFTLEMSDYQTRHYLLAVLLKFLNHPTRLFLCIVGGVITSGRLIAVTCQLGQLLPERRITVLLPADEIV